MSEAAICKKVIGDIRGKETVEKEWGARGRKKQAALGKSEAEPGREKVGYLSGEGAERRFKERAEVPNSRSNSCNLQKKKKGAIGGEKIRAKSVRLPWGDQEGEPEISLNGGAESRPKSRGGGRWEILAGEDVNNAASHIGG